MAQSTMESTYCKMLWPCVGEQVPDWLKEWLTKRTTAEDHAKCVYKILQDISKKTDSSLSKIMLKKIPITDAIEEKLLEKKFSEKNKDPKGSKDSGNWEIRSSSESLQNSEGSNNHFKRYKCESENSEKCEVECEMVVQENPVEKAFKINIYLPKSAFEIREGSLREKSNACYHEHIEPTGVLNNSCSFLVFDKPLASSTFIGEDSKENILEELQSMKDLKIEENYEDLKTKVASNDEKGDIQDIQMSKCFTQTLPSRSNLMRRVNGTRSRNKSSPDAKVVKSLVKDRFKDALQDVYNKTLTREVIRENCASSWNILSENLSSLITANNDQSKDNMNSPNHSVLNHTIPEEPEKSNSHTLEENKNESNVDLNQTIYSDSSDEGAYDLQPEDDEVDNIEDVVAVITLPKEEKAEVVTVDTDSKVSNDNSEQILENAVVIIKRQPSPTSEYDEYNEESFLRNALGENLNLLESTVATTEAMYHENVTLYNDHRFEQHDHQALIKIKRMNLRGQVLNDSSSIGSSQISTLISNPRTSIHSSSRRNNMMGNQNTDTTLNQTVTEFNTIHSNSSDTDYSSVYDEYKPEVLENKFESLVNDIAVQDQMIAQATKALEVCKATKEFASSREEVEAEKILLVATLKKTVYQEEMKKVYEDVPDENTNLGTITLSQMVFPLHKNRANPVQIQSPKRVEYTRWFVAVLRYGTSIVATNVVSSENPDMIIFNDIFEFKHLLPYFEVKVTLYSVRMKNNLRSFSHESKYHLKDQRTVSCSKMRKMFSFKSLHIPPEPTQSVAKKSSFEEWAEFSIKIGDLKRASEGIPVQVLDPSANLIGTVILRMIGEVEITDTHSGFLTIGTEEGCTLSWNRRWCILQGPKIYFWNHPNDEPMEETMVGELDISNCISSWIDKADRQLCARPKTLMMELFYQPQLKGKISTRKHRRASRIIERYYLHVDSSIQLQAWQKKLNNVVSALRNWTNVKNILPPPYKQPSSRKPLV